jgi:hypothetical protein
VIELLNRYFVPVFTSNEDYRDGGAAPADERAELQRIFKEGYDKKLSVGSVHAYVIGPDGHLLSSLHTAEAAKPAKLIALLQEAVGALKTKPGEPAVKPCPPDTPDCGPTSLRLYLIARYLERKGDDYALTEDPGGGWAAVPGVDWICLNKPEWSALVPARGATIGTKWALPGDLSRPILTHFYPPTENNNVLKNKIEAGALTATLTERTGSTAVVKIDGNLKMKHDFYHKEDGRYVEAGVVGYARVDTKAGVVKSFDLVTDRAEYYDGEGKNPLAFGVAVKLSP